MLSIDASNIGQRLLLKDYESAPDRVLEGVLTEVDFSHRDRLFWKLRLDNTWFYLTDWGTFDVLEKDGKTLPTEPGVYEVETEVLGDDRLVQLDVDGQWWPYPYVFSGWRTSELLMFRSLKPRSDLQVDYPKIKDPEKRETHLAEMRMKASIWRAGYEASRRGDQEFTNPYSVCSICDGEAGDHDQLKHDRYYAE